METAWEKMWAVVVGALLLGLIALVTVPIYKSIASDNKIEYCYVRTWSYHVPTQADVVRYDLCGFVPWRSDRCIAQNLSSLEAAKAEADRVSCPMK